MTQPTTHNQFSQPDGSPSASVPKRESAQTDRSPEDLASALKSTEQQLEAVSQENRRLVQHNQKLQIEIERIMASALNLHHIVHAGPTATPTPAADNASSPGDALTADRITASDTSDRAIAPEPPPGPSDDPQPPPTPSSSSDPPSVGEATEHDADDMFAELDRLLADDLPSQPPQSFSQHDSLQAALSHVDSRHRVNGSRPEQPKPLSPKLPTNLRRTVAVPPQPAASSNAAPRRSNLWLILATVAVMLSCFGAGFLITLPLLQSSDR